MPAGGVWALTELLCRGHDSPGTVHRPLLPGPHVVSGQQQVSALREKLSWKRLWPGPRLLSAPSLGRKEVSGLGGSLEPVRSGKGKVPKPKASTSCQATVRLGGVKGRECLENKPRS